MSRYIFLFCVGVIFSIMSVYFVNYYIGFKFSNKIQLTLILMKIVAQRFYFLYFRTQSIT
jgi:hypothetical protein